MRELVKIAVTATMVGALAACASSPSIPAAQSAISSVGSAFSTVQVENRARPETPSPSLFPDFYLVGTEYQAAFIQRLLEVPSQAVDSGNGPNSLRFVLRESLVGFDNIPSDAMAGVPFVNLLTGLSSLSTERPFQARVRGTLEVVDPAGKVLRFRDIEIVSEVMGKSGEIEASLGRLADKASEDLATEIHLAIDRYL